MSDRLSDIGQRIVTVHQLGAVVNAMRGMAGARAQRARALLPAIRTYADTARRAIADARRLPGFGGGSGGGPPGRPITIAFGAEEGFAGAFADQVLDATRGDFAAGPVLLIGGRTAADATEHGFAPVWTTGLPSRAAALPQLASAVVDALYDHLATLGGTAVAMRYPMWRSGSGVTVVRRSLLPFDASAFPATPSREPPLTNLPAAPLIERLAQEYVFAQICEAAVEGFAAENAARMEAMASAKTNIDGKLAGLKAEERLVRQETITAEVVELAAGVRARTPMAS
jgi:F-type H+-transporting ATPase subunit gamma